MSYINDVINRALQRSIQDIRKESKPRLKYKKRAANRDRLYKKRLRLGRVRK